MGDLRETFNLLLDAAELAEREKQKDEATTIRKAQDAPGAHIRLYLPRLRLVAVAVALGIADSAFDRVVLSVRPLLTDRLVSSLVATRRPRKSIGAQCWFPKRFATLADVFDVDPDARGAMLSAYLRRWYGRMRGTEWWDGHKFLQKFHYVGYWAFEAAAVACALDMDDRTFRGGQFYPAHLRRGTDL